VWESSSGSISGSSNENDGVCVSSDDVGKSDGVWRGDGDERLNSGR